MILASNQRLLCLADTIEAAKKATTANQTDQARDDLDRLSVEDDPNVILACEKCPATCSPAQLGEMASGAADVVFDDCATD